MKIALLSNYLPDGQESMLRFAQLLYQEYIKLGHRVNLVYPPVIFGRFGNPHQGLGKWLGYLDKFVLFPPRLWFLQADIIHICDHGNGMWIPHIKQKRHLVTCNDLLAIRSALGLVPQNPTSKTGVVFQKMIINGLSQVKFSACISEATRRDFINIVKVKAEQTQVIYMGQNSSYGKLSKNEALDYFSSHHDLLKTPFIMHIGDEKWYKNRPGLLRVFSIYRQQNPQSKLKLVLAGKPLSDSLKHYIQDLRLNEYIVEFIKPSNNELAALYSTAQALLFPSLDEGFGWPVIEAQACGCPVVCSNNGALAEVAAQGALTAPATDEFQLAKLLSQAIHNPKVREQLIAEGYENIKKFTTEKMVQAYLDLYRKIIDDQT